jgi:hypothetical protein
MKTKPTDSVPWHEAYSEYSEGQLIGTALAGAQNLIVKEVIFFPY